MFAQNVGDNSSDGYPIMTLDCPPAATITVTVVAASPGSLTCKQYPDDPSPTTITAGNSQSFTTSILAYCPGSIASIQVTGGTY
jgi:hypothetical protein